MGIVDTIMQAIFGQSPATTVSQDPYIIERRNAVVVQPKKTYLIKQTNTGSLERPTAHSLLLGVTAHISRAATAILANKVIHRGQIDQDYHQLAINMHRLANEIHTFMNKKADISGEKTP